MAPKAAPAELSHAKGREGKTVEQVYQKKTQLEHILLRPDTYVGSVEKQQQELWVFDAGQSRMVHRSISYVPALYKIFDEILVNAADNLIRDPVGMDTIKVDIDPKTGTISVFNNGRGLPVVIHKEQKVYVPEMVFGHLLTSDNYNDGDCKVVGGRNGYGAKLANVFSTSFIVETADEANKYRQVFEKNMTVKHQPEVTPNKGKSHTKSYTKVMFKPDLARLGMTELDSDIVSLLAKRVYDIAGSTVEKCTVYLNGDKLDIKSFKEYTDLYLLAKVGVPQIFEKCSERWEVCVSLTEGTFQQVSFVNSICTTRGGTHVQHVADQVVEVILEKARAKSKEQVKGGVDVRPHHVRNHLWVFVKCLIENPAFDSQTKETLTTKQSKFGSRCELSEEFLEQVVNSGVVDLILTWALAKTKVALGKQLKANTGKVTRLQGVPKLEDANDAGGPKSAECTLILTEGDSAKATAVSGISVVGRDKYGVFPLRGKVLNVRDATFAQMMANAEIQSIMKIVGLDLNREYDAERKGLRYGSIMIMTDQDHDGSHIKGLLINLLHAWWPSLAKLPGFVKEFFTPIVKATKKGSRSNKPISFYTLPEYESWKSETNNGEGYNIKYYKGLGTSTQKEAKEYFSAIEHHTIDFRHDDQQDDEAIDLAFNKKRADNRKEWINGYEEGTFVDHTAKELRYKDFVDKELILFSIASVERAIPSMVDGFKTGQRKVMFSCFKRKLKNDAKVAQLAGYVAEHAAYHHGEGALNETIVGMAQDFPGSNNVHLLYPSGQFGTRLQGGKDAASTRYIYTRLMPATRLIFHEHDDSVLDFLKEEGQSIEPRWYCPIIPMVLVNGAEGIGTGWSTSVPNFNPREVIANLRLWMAGKPLKDMLPWYRGFKGSIKEAHREEGKVEVVGLFEKTGENTVEITELPVKKWTQDYREFLEELVSKDGKSSKGALLEDYKEFHTERTVHFECTLTAEGVNAGENQGLERAFKLKSSLSMNNMILFDAKGKIKKYDTVLDIIRDFAELRLEFYGKRKDFLMRRLTRESTILNEKMRFIRLVLNGELVIKRRKLADLIADLKRKAFKPMSDINAAGGAEGEEGADDDGDDDVDDDDEDDGEAEGEAAAKKAAVKKGVKDFEYLVGMPISTLTAEKIAELKKLNDVKLAELADLKKTKPETIWQRDLTALEECLDKQDADTAAAEKEEKAKIAKARAKSAAKSKDAAAKRGVKRAASAEPKVDHVQAAPARSAAQKRAASVDAPESKARGRQRK